MRTKIYSISGIFNIDVGKKLAYIWCNRNGKADTMANKFADWFDTFNSEKGISADKVIEVEGESGTNHMPLECLFDAIKRAPASEQTGIKNMLVKIDFANAPVMPFYQHLAKAIAI